jgi:glycerol-3-phosphate dehydrogenase
MADKYDVPVIGGGPRGITCIAPLASWGLKVLLLDNNPR